MLYPLWEGRIFTVMAAPQKIANSSGKAAAEAPDGFDKEVKDFSDHCVYIRSVYVLATRIWRDTKDEDRKLMEFTAPAFFLDLGQVLAEYAILSACRVTDPAGEGERENLT
jgi:hypothetical protein